MEKYIRKRHEILSGFLAQHGFQGLLLKDGPTATWLGLTARPPTSLRYMLLIVREGTLRAEEHLSLTSLAEAASGLGSIAMDHGFTGEESARLIDQKVRLSPLGRELAYLRSKKDPLEMRLLKLIADATIRAFEIGFKNLMLGVSGHEIACAMLKVGAERKLRPAFDPMVAIAQETAASWSPPTCNPLVPDTPVLIDFGLEGGGYKSDISASFFLTRERRIDSCLPTFDLQPPPSLGKPLSSVDKYERWLAACKALQYIFVKLLNEMRPGVSVKGLVEKYYTWINEAGFDPAQANPLGHGVGLELHEPPFLVPNSKEHLKEGNVLAIEPGLTFEDFGIRIEAMVFLTKGSMCVYAPGAKVWRRKYA